VENYGKLQSGIFKHAGSRNNKVHIFVFVNPKKQIIKKLISLFVLILFHAVACAQADYRARYFLTVGGNFTRDDFGVIKLRPMPLPAIGTDLTHHYSDMIAINAGTRYSFRGPANDTLLVHNHYHDFFVAPRYIITPGISAKLGLQFNNLMHGASWLHHNKKRIKGGSLYESQLEVYAGITYNISRDVNVNILYTLPGPWMNHSSLMAGISYRMLPRYKAAAVSSHWMKHLKMILPAK